ncbi:MAG: DUF4194 domain-containing protein [Treponema sp.]|jgi:hypothetical protein|nr:DUF4194 domain-containing protein [Treponema sp.]
MNSYERDENETEKGLFTGDTGELALDTRRALVQLLSGPVLDGKRHTKLWPVLIINEDIIRRRLADLFLELVIDPDMQVAFTRQANTGDLEVPHLLRRARLTFIDSVLLIFLRQQLSQAETRSDHAVVSKDEIEEHLKLYEKAANTDKAGFVKKIHASIEKFKQRSILQKIPKSDDRFEISPTLKLLFSAEVIIDLTKRYKRMAEEGMPVNDAEGEDEEE